MTATRTDPERHREQVRAANRARHRANKRLQAKYPLDWDVFYAEEAAKEGVEPKPRVGNEVAEMRGQIAALTAQVTRLTAKTRSKKK